MDHPPDPEPDPPGRRAALRRLLADGAVFDAHVDAIGRALDLGHDLRRRGPGHFDLERAREGGVGAWVVVAWVDPELHLERALTRATEMLACARALEDSDDSFRLVGNGRELAGARRQGLTAGILGIEGGHALEGRLENLRALFDYGLRVLTLVWNNHLPWIRSCADGADASVPEGLSDFGREVVREMNRLGVLVDLSHASRRAFHDALETTGVPVMASHSGCSALHDHPRNLTDAQLRALAENDGCVGIVFHPGFLDAEARKEESRVRGGASYRSLDGSDPAAAFVARQEILRREARPLPLERLVDHVAHAASVAGVRHVGLGSDFDGIERGPEGLEDATGYPRLAEALLGRGFEEHEVAAILGGNLRRVFAHATGPDTLAGRVERAAWATEVRRALPAEAAAAPCARTTPVPRG